MRRGQLGLLLFDVKIDQHVDDELIDDITEGGAAKGGAEGREDLCGGGVDAWKVEDRESGPCAVAGDQREVWGGFAAVSTGDDGAGAGVDEPLEEGVTGTHDVITRVFVEDGGEQGVGEDAVGDAMGDGC